MQFNKEQAQKYDQKHVKLQSMRDAMHLCMQIVLRELPEDARILCVGAGTGMELLDLAQAKPGWQFTAVEPSAAMLEICRHRMQAAGLDARCTYHEGYLDTLPETESFDVATCILVSHFILDKDARIALFKGMHDRLRPGGSLISADFAGDVDSPLYAEMLHQWLNLQRHAGLTEEGINNHAAAIKEKLMVFAPAGVEQLMHSAGFAAPLQIFQMLMLHMWLGRRSQ